MTGTSSLAGQPDVSFSQERFLAVAESLNDAVIGAATDQGIVFWNSAAERIFGWKREEILGRPLTDLMPERFREPHLAGVARVLSGGDPHVLGRSTVELVALRRDGVEFPIELSLGRYESAEGTQFTGVVRDVSERVLAQRYLGAQSAVGRALVEAGSEDEAVALLLPALGEAAGWALGGLWLYDAEREVLRNRGIWHAPGVETPEFDEATRDLELPVGLGLPGLVAKSRRAQWFDDAAAHPASLRAPDAAAAGLHGAVVVPMLGGDELVGIVEFYLDRAAAPDEELMRVMELLSVQLGLFFQRTRARRETEELAAELARSNADLEQFASIASHDLTEPLRTVGGFARLLQRRYTGKLDEEADEWIEYITGGVGRMNALIESLLVYSRAGSGTMELETVDLAEAARSALFGLREAIDEAGAEIRVDQLPDVRGNAPRLAQVLQNLVANALKFRRPGGAPRVTISASPGEDPAEWRIDVADDGIGIDPEHAERIFGMFSRLHGRDEYAGTGIGLALCARIIERHGGRIWVEPAAPNGSRFSFTLPAA